MTSNVFRMKYSFVLLFALVGLVVRSNAQIAPACAGDGKCYECNDGATAAILNGNACYCGDGSKCKQVSQQANPVVVGPVIEPKVQGSPRGSGDGECRQSSPGQAGSRCGDPPVDLIGYCEDESPCRSGDNACCVQDEKTGAWKPECNC